MKDIEEILADRKAEAQKLQERNDLATKVNDGFRSASSSSAEKTVAALSKGVRVNNLHEVPKSSIDINLNGLETLQVDSVNIGGMEDFLMAIVKEMRAIKEDIKNISINPEFKMPDITIPEMKIPDTKVTVSAPPVTVKVPDIKIPKAEVVIKHDGPRKVYEKDIYKQGILDGYEIGYEDGTKMISTGWAVGNVKYKYD